MPVTTEDGTQLTVSPNSSPLITNVSGQHCYRCKLEKSLCVCSVCPVRQRRRLTFTMPLSTSPRTSPILCTATSDQLDPADTRTKKSLSTLLSNLTVPALPRGELLQAFSRIDEVLNFNTFIASAIAYFVDIFSLCLCLILCQSPDFYFFFLSEQEGQKVGRIQLHCTVQSTELLNAKGISSLSVSSFFLFQPW